MSSRLEVSQAYIYDVNLIKLFGSSSHHNLFSTFYASFDSSRLTSFGTTSLRRILSYRWHDYMSNDLVLKEAGLRQVTCLVRERQLRLYGHVVRLPAEDPAHRILFVEIRGAGPCQGASTCFMSASGGVLPQGYGHFGSARAMARRRPK